MEVFREFKITATGERMAGAVLAIEKALPAGWTRDQSTEVQARANPTIIKRDTYCFRCVQEGRRPAALLILAQKDSDTFQVSNIVPLERHQLAHAQYNAVLEDFVARVFKPYADQAGLACSFTGAEAGLEDWMSAEAAARLRAFSAGANKGTGSSHPNDRERWNDFVLSAHQTGCELDSSTLSRWLIEAENWPPEVAEQLAVEYEYGRELLAFARVPEVAA